jgi:putative transposase
LFCGGYTYIRLQGGFIYLVAILDWYSRYIIAWRLSDTMETTFCIETLTDALTQAQPHIHNSDQGSQFTAHEYIDTLKAYPNINISMDGRGRCFDNIFTERLW